MPGCSIARSVDARVSVTSTPGPAQRGQQLGPRVGVEPRGVEGVAYLGRQLVELLRPGAAGRPRPEQLGEQALVDVGAPRHPGVRHLDRDEGARRLGRQQQTEPRGLGRRRHGGQLPGVLDVGPQVLGRVVDREQGRVGGRARPEPVPVLRLLPVQQPPVHGGRPTQQVVAQPQVVAAADAHPGRQQRRVPPGGVVPHPPRLVGLARRARTPAGRRAPPRAPRRRPPPAPGRPAGARARRGSPAHPGTPRRHASVRGGGWGACRARPSRSTPACRRTR